MASRNLLDLDPEVAILARKMLDKCKISGIDIIITCTYRSNEEQQIEYDKGRKNTLRKTTNAKPGESLHNITANNKPASRAFDVVPMVNGKCVWNNEDPLWQQVGIIGKSLGLEWAGDFKTFKEYPHFQLPIKK